MKEQLTAILGVFTSPKRTMRQLSSTRIYVLSIIAPLYFSVVRAFKPRNYALLREKLGGDIQIVLFVCALGVVMLPVGGWLMRQSLKLFGKRLSVVKILNINGYSFVPRIVTALIGYAVLFANPALLQTERPTPLFIMLIVVGFAGMLYSLYLMICGIVVSPSER